MSASGCSPSLPTPLTPATANPLSDPYPVLLAGPFRSLEPPRARSFFGDWSVYFPSLLQARLPPSGLEERALVWTRPIGLPLVGGGV